MVGSILTQRRPPDSWAYRITWQHLNPESTGLLFSIGVHNVASYSQKHSYEVGRGAASIANTPAGCVTGPFPLIIRVILGSDSHHCENGSDGKWEELVTWHIVVPVILTAPTPSSYTIACSGELKSTPTFNDVNSLSDSSVSYKNFLPHTCQ